MKYSLSMSEILRVELEVFPKGSGYISLYIPTGVIIQTLSIYEYYKSSVVLSWEGSIGIVVLCISLAAKAIFFRIDQAHKKWDNIGESLLHLIRGVFSMSAMLQFFSKLSCDYRITKSMDDCSVLGRLQFTALGQICILSRIW